MSADIPLSGAAAMMSECRQGRYEIKCRMRRSAPLAMRMLPKSWLDVATSVHFYEALLATLAIVVWHFYSVIFDPEIYPLNTAFLTGYSIKKSEHSREQHEVAKAAGD